MELKHFIKSSLLDIMAGVHEAQSEWNAGENNKGVINPAWGKTSERHVSIVNFDIAVTAGTNTDGSINAGIKVLGIDFGGKSNEGRTDSTVSHIKFDVPIIASTIEVKEDAVALDYSTLRKGIV